MINIHTDQQGYIWTCSNKQMPTNTKTKIDQYLSLIAQSNQKDISLRLTACKSNIDLIVRLYCLKLERKIQSVKVCSPMFCKTMKRRTNPALVLLDALNIDGWPSSLGGWHEVDENDYVSYYIARNFETLNLPYENISSLLKLHPIWHKLSFISHLDYEKCARLIGLILDPRWFIDLVEPNKQAKLERYLGLYPHKHCISRYTNSLPNLVYNCWKTDRPEDINQPNAFLWRIYLAEAKKSEFKAILRTSQIFISFLRNIWLEELYKSSQTKDPLFVPEYFFKDKQELTAYSSHVALFNQVI